jgi:flagellar motor protein MotB
VIPPDNPKTLGRSSHPNLVPNRSKKAPKNESGEESIPESVKESHFEDFEKTIQNYSLTEFAQTTAGPGPNTNDCRRSLTPVMTPGKLQTEKLSCDSSNQIKNSVKLKNVLDKLLKSEKHQQQEQEQNLKQEQQQNQQQEQQKQQQQQQQQQQPQQQQPQKQLLLLQQQNQLLSRLQQQQSLRQQCQQNQLRQSCGTDFVESWANALSFPSPNPDPINLNISLNLFDTFRSSSVGPPLLDFQQMGVNPMHCGAK